MTWFSYIVWTANDQFYTGVTTDLKRRVCEHNHVQKKASKMCWANRPVMLVWYREEKSKSAAYKAEARIKKLSRMKKVELIASLPDDKKLELLRKRKEDYRAFTAITKRPPRGELQEPCDHPGCMSHVTHPCEKCGRQWSGDVIPSLGEIVKRIRAQPLTSDCTSEILARHKVLLAIEIKRLLLEHGLEKGWKLARAQHTQPVLGMTRLNRELTDEELEVLKETLGYEFDRSGNIVDRNQRGDIRSVDGGGRRGLFNGGERRDLKAEQD